jgi:hypothetical protein
MFIPAVLRGEEVSDGNLRQGVSTASVAAVGTAFLEVRAVSWVLCLFRLRTSLKPSSWVAEDFDGLDCSAAVLALSTAFNSCRATVYVAYKGTKQGLPTEGFTAVFILLRPVYDGRPLFTHPPKL